LVAARGPFLKKDKDNLAGWAGRDWRRYCEKRDRTLKREKATEEKGAKKKEATSFDEQGPGPRIFSFGGPKPELLKKRKSNMRTGGRGTNFLRKESRRDKAQAVKAKKTQKRKSKHQKMTGGAW